MTQPRLEMEDDADDAQTPGTPRWYLRRLTQRLMARRHRYDKLERYALGHHDLPNGDRRYVVALRNLQRKARTNYCELVIRAVTERMDPLGFQFGPHEQVDEEAKRIWAFNDMEYQAPLLINMCATFGDAYIMVSPPEGDGEEPIWTILDPTMCITEQDPRYPTRTLAGLRLWQDDTEPAMVAILYLPNEIRRYEAPAVTDNIGTDTASLTTKLVGDGPNGGQFTLVEVQPNPTGEVTIFRVAWQPAFGTQSRAEHESILDIQDRINLTILDRLVISKSQAYNQRWVTGAKKGEEFKPGSDVVWATTNETAKMGQFEAADLTQILEAVRDDIGDLAAISQTPASYLMNRMVNVSGDTLYQDQAALTSKIRLRQAAVGYGLEKAMRCSFRLKGNPKAEEAQVQVLWRRPSIYKLEALGDFIQKTISAGLPVDVVMKVTDLFTDDQIKAAQQHAEELQRREEEMQQRELENAVQVARTAPPQRSTS